MTNRPEDNASKGAPPRPAEELLERRPDNIGQSGRWRVEDGTEHDEVARHYGKEEHWHSTEHPVTPADELPTREPNADKPNTSPYQRPSASPEQGEKAGDDNARYRDESYAKAGGETGANQPKSPDDRWKDQSGAGHGENYGVGRDAEGGDGSKPLK